MKTICLIGFTSAASLGVVEALKRYVSGAKFVEVDGDFSETSGLTGAAALAWRGDEEVSAEADLAYEAIKAGLPVVASLSDEALMDLYHVVGWYAPYNGRELAFENRLGPSSFHRDGVERRLSFPRGRKSRGITQFVARSA